MTGTASLSKGVHREVGSEGSWGQNSDSTNRNRIQGRRSGVTRQWTGRPNSHPDTCVGKSGGDRGKDVRLTLGGLWGCPNGIGTTAPATVGEGPGEVSRGHSNSSRTGRMKGRIFYCKEPVRRTRWAWSGSKARPTNSPFLNGGRRPCATASLVKAEPELGRARSSKRPRRLNGNEP